MIDLKSGDHQTHIIQCKSVTISKSPSVEKKPSRSGSNKQDESPPRSRDKSEQSVGSNKSDKSVKSASRSVRRSKSPSNGGRRDRSGSRESRRGGSKKSRSPYTMRSGKYYDERARVFVGGGISDRVNEDTVKRLFHKFGDILEVSMKGRYGFV